MAEKSFHNRPCWTIKNADIRVSVMKSSGHIAELVLEDTPDLNPLWAPDRPTIDSGQYDPAIDGATYGPSKAENTSVMTYHGETNIVRLEEVQHSDDSLVVSALLPNSLLRSTRTLRCVGQSLTCESVAENLSAWDRPVGWCEHVTLGPPFLERVSPGLKHRWSADSAPTNDSHVAFPWPEGHGSVTCNLSCTVECNTANWSTHSCRSRARIRMFYRRKSPSRSRSGICLSPRRISLAQRLGEL
jgi:hypothetical protein